MMNHRNARRALTAVLVLTLAVATAMLMQSSGRTGRTTVVAYFANSNGIFAGDEVRILGVPVGRIERIEPEPRRVKITFWFDDEQKVPADAKAVILSPSLVTARVIQLTPAYTGGAQMQTNAVIPQERTAVPVEWDELREQLERLTEAMQPDAPGGVSALGAVVTTAAQNLRGQGALIRDAIIKLAQAITVLGDHSKDLFSTLNNVSVLVSALQSSSDLTRRLNQNLAAMTGLLTDQPDEVGRAVTALSGAVEAVQGFVADNRESLGTTFDKLASVSTALDASLGDLRQTLHIAPNELQNFVNIYQPAQGTLSGAQAWNNFANPINFLCGAVQAASRMGAEQSAKLCVQYLAPIVKNRQFNFPPLGENLIVGAAARPNEVTYSEDWMRPDYVPPQTPNPVEAQQQPLLPAEMVATDPGDGLRGMMVPEGGGP